MPRPRRIIFDIAPQPHNEIVDGARIGVFVQAPDIFKHGLPRHRRAFVLDQVTEDVGFHQGQRELLAPDVKFKKVEVNRLLAECESALGLGWRHDVVRLVRRSVIGGFMIQ